MATDLTLFNRFAPVIRNLSYADLESRPILSEKLLIERNGALEVCYTPFEHVNAEARLVIVGITPGFTQMVNAVRELRNAINEGASAEDALVRAKKVGAFSGSLRTNLVQILDHAGISRWLGVSSCSELFAGSSHLIQSASILRNAVFKDGGNYNGTPNMTRNVMLRQQLAKTLGKDAAGFERAVFLPLGSKVAEGLEYLASQGLVSRDRILPAVPHPSGGNIERIHYFLGKKEVAALSAKTNAKLIDDARTSLLGRVSALA